MAQPRSLPLVFQAKLYELQLQDGQDVWIERGVGVPSFTRQQNLYKLRFYTQDELNPYRYELVVNCNTVFQQSESKIITWTLVKDSLRETVEMALSFREESGALHFWKLIEEYLAKDAVQVQVNSGEVFVLEYKVQDPTSHNIGDILHDFQQIPQTEKRQRICSVFLTKRDLLPKLRLLFNSLEEDRERNRQHLEKMFELMKLVLNYSDMELLNELLGEEYCLFTFGCLEYDPQFRNCPPQHREFLRKHSRFTEVIPIKNRERLQKIHFTYRLEYVKDCALAHLLDDVGLRLHTMIVLTNYRDTLANFIFNSKEKDYLNQLFGLLRMQEVRAYRMLGEICRVAKLIDLLLTGSTEIQKDMVYCTLADKEIYEILMVNIKQMEQATQTGTFHPTQKSRLKTLEQLAEVTTISLQYTTNSMEVCPKYFKSYCTSERERVMKYPLVNYLLDALIRTRTHSSEVTQQATQLSKLVGLLVDSTEVHQLTPIIQVAFLQLLLKAEAHFELLVAVLNKLTDNISEAIASKLPQLVQKLCTVLMHHSRGQKCLKVTVLQILKKLQALYHSQQPLKQQLIQALTDNTHVLVQELLLSKAHSSLHLSAVLSLLLQVRRSECTDLLRRICQQLREVQAAKQHTLNLYISRLLQFVEHIILWTEVAPPVLKRERQSQVTNLGQEDFEGLPDKKLKTA